VTRRMNGTVMNLSTDRLCRAAEITRAELQPVRLEFRDDQAQSVAIIDSFNQWQIEGTRMLRVQPGRWLRVLFLPPGRYEYVFVVDGLSVADPSATEIVPNVYGCRNSVLRIPPRAYNAARSPGNHATEYQTQAYSNPQRCRRTNRLLPPVIRRRATKSVTRIIRTKSGCFTKARRRTKNFQPLLGLDQ